MANARDEYVFMAKLAEQAERYEDMVEYMRRVAQMGSELSVDERNLLSVAYKHSVGARRQAWRAVAQLQSKEGTTSPFVMELVDGYRVKVETELTTMCLEIIELLSKDLIKPATGAGNEPQVFYLKMKGDYYRYLAEFASGDDQSKYAQEAHDAYGAASKIAKENLQPSHPIRLGLALNFSVFFYEVFRNPDAACNLAKEAFDSAMAMTSDSSEEELKDSAQIMQLLRDNLTLWTNDMAAGGDGRAPEQDGTTVEDC
jgi:14-3-3 protein epsilon